MKSNQDRLLQLEREFDSWRASRKRGARIPETLWNQVVSLTNDYSVNKLVKRLKLDPNSLKKRMKSRDRTEFKIVEIKSPDHTPALAPTNRPIAQRSAQLVAEVTTVSGSYARVFSGASPSDIENLSMLLRSV